MKDKYILKDIKDIEIGDIMFDLDNNTVTVINCDNIMQIVESGKVVWTNGDDKYTTLCEVVEQVTKELAQVTKELTHVTKELEQLKESLNQANGKHSTLLPLNRASRDYWRRNW